MKRRTGGSLLLEGKESSQFVVHGFRCRVDRYIWKFPWLTVNGGYPLNLLLLDVFFVVVQ